MNERTDTEINQFIHTKIYKECWHEYNRRESGYPICGICNKSMQWSKPDYAGDIASAFAAVETFKDLLLKQPDDIAEEMYRAFASRIKKDSLPSGSYADNQRLGNVEFFLLYLITPKTICLALIESYESGLKAWKE